MFTLEVAANIIGWDAGGRAAAHRRGAGARASRPPPRRSRMATEPPAPVVVGSGRGTRRRGRSTSPRSPPRSSPASTCFRRGRRRAHPGQRGCDPAARRDARDRPGPAARGRGAAEARAALARRRLADMAASAASAPAPAASAPGPPQPALDWPPSTRLVYELTGMYRGPLSGSGVPSNGGATASTTSVEFNYNVSFFLDGHQFQADGRVGAEGLEAAALRRVAQGRRTKRPAGEEDRVRRRRGAAEQRPAHGAAAADAGSARASSSSSCGCSTRTPNA